MHCVGIGIEKFGVETFHKKSPREEVVKNVLLSLIKNLNPAGNLRNELLLLVVPRNSQLTGTNIDFEDQASTVSGAIENLCYESVTRDAGWKRMPSLVKIFSILGHGLTMFDHYGLLKIVVKKSSKKAKKCFLYYGTGNQW